MNKKELVAAMADDCGLPQKSCAKALDSLFAIIKERVFRDDPVRLVGIGTFRLNVRKSRAGINPKTGDKIVIPERRRIVFKAGKNINTIS